MVPKKLNPKYTFDQFNNEVNELYDYLKLNKYSEKEIKKIFLPLQPNKEQKDIFSFILFVTLTLSTLFYFLTYLENISWHFSAIGRIFLIKILPYWDWTQLKNKKCLLPSFGSTHKDQNFNCDLCENINKIDAYNAIEENILIQKYIDLDVPIILTKGLNSWPQNSSFVEKIIADGVIYNSYPCHLSTNTQKGNTNLGRILENTKNFESFFLHFQNCDLEAMKHFRKFTYRPKFLPAVYSPVLYNWLIWSKNYNISNYKAINLVEKITIVGQIFGSTYFKLTPRKNCEFECPVLEIILNRGETLIFTSLWNLEYRPYEDEENMAVILETRD